MDLPSWLALTATDEHDRKKERILNTLLGCSILLAFFCSYVTIHDRWVYGAAYHGLSFYVVLTVLLIFIGLYFLSRKGHRKLASILFIGVYLLPLIYASAKWGVDLPQIILFDALIVTMAGVLINTRTSVITAIILSIVLITLAWAHESGIIQPESYWRMQPAFLKDAIVLSATLTVMTAVSWLSNQQIETSLARALRSEAALTKERDQLEENVAARTSELEQLQKERLLQFAKFAEYGRIAAGLTHDLGNPITSLSLILEELTRLETTKEQEVIPHQHVAQALLATNQLKDFLQAARKQIQEHDVCETFSLEKEVQQVLSVLGYRAKLAGVSFETAIDPEITCSGNPIKFQKLIMNLVANAVDAYASSHEGAMRLVHVRARRVVGQIELTVEDWGSGIPEAFAQNIFQPFYTTKGVECGIGLGLANCKDIVENAFHGSIRFESTPGQGTRFIALLSPEPLYADVSDPDPPRLSDAMP